MAQDSYYRATAGWLAGCLTATIVIDLFGLLNLATAGGFLGRSVFGILFFIGVAPLIFFTVLMFSGLPAMIFIALSEMLRIRSILFFGCAGAAIGALSEFLLSRIFPLQLPSFSPLFFVAGFAAGSAYWFVAGKYAGSDRPVSSAST